MRNTFFLIRLQNKANTLYDGNAISKTNGNGNNRLFPQENVEVLANHNNFNVSVERVLIFIAKSAENL